MKLKLEGGMIHAFQILLQPRFPAFHGLHLPRLVEMCTNELVVDKSWDWLQVIHVANRAHWVCVHKRSDNDYVRLYDSLKSTKISEHIGEQDLSIQGTDTVLFKHENVAQQKGAEDCGLFALSFATYLFIYLFKFKVCGLELVFILQGATDRPYKLN